MEQVAPSVYRAGTRFVNWYVVDAGADGLTLIDAGFPKYASRLDASLAAINKTRKDVRAVVLTHGHIDHIGMAATLAKSGATVHLHPDDAALAAAPKTNKPQRTLPYLLWPATVAFMGHAVAQGALQPDPMPTSTPLVDGAEADAPGRPLVTHVPGHTAGSCVLEFREHGVVFAGDLLCTVNPLLGRPDAPQLQSRGSNRDSEQAMSSLHRIEAIQSRTVLPGHGNPWTDGVMAAVASARRIGCR
jgi:glyoxylase-like metal-dependent hydrolase (beta-lactamase superfamily II)